MPWTVRLPALLLFLGALALRLHAEEEDEAATAARKQAVYEAYAGRDARWKRMGAPQPGEWLARFPEPGQTPEAYRGRWRGKKKSGPARIVLVPLGDFAGEHEKLLEVMREYAQIFFDTPTVIGPVRPFPADSWSAERRQHNAGLLLQDLADGVADDCLARVGFTHEDLYANRLNFVFGVGSPSSRTGVYSIHRLGQPAERLLERTLRLMNHEIGHILGIDHCIFYSCSMNGSNSLAESDRRPIHYCPPDEDKLAWVLGSPTAARFRALAGFYRRQGMDADAAFLEAEAGDPPPPGRSPR